MMQGRAEKLWTISMLANVLLTEGARCIYLQPFIYTLGMKEVRTLQFFQIHAIFVHFKADAANLEAAGDFKLVLLSIEK